MDREETVVSEFLLSLGKYGIKQFHDWSDLKNWLDTQINFFKDINANLRGEGITANYVDSFIKRLEGMRRALKTASTRETTLANDEIEEWLAIRLELFRIYDFLRGHAPVAEERTVYEQKFEQEDARGVAKTLEERLAKVINYPRIENGVGIKEQEKFERERLASLELFKEQERRLFKENLDDLKDGTSELKKQLASAKRALGEETDRQQSFISNGEKLLEEMKNARKGFREELGLIESYKYWDEKKTSHEDRRSTYLGLMMVWLALAVITIYQVNLDFRSGVLNADSVYDLIPFLPGNIIIVITFVWGFRVLIKLALSENHLITRSEEKRVLIQTYVALTKEGKAEKEERQIILSSVFAPSQDGVLVEDGMPMPMANPIKVVNDINKLTAP